MKKNEGIGFHLVGITTEEYAELPDHFPDQKQPRIGIKLQKNIRINDTARMVGLYTKFEFLNEDQIFLILEVACHFKIEAEYWNSAKDIKADTITLDKKLLTHFLVLTVGTSRGVLHAKKPKELYNLMLPTFDVTKEFDEDVVLSLSDDEEE